VVVILRSVVTQRGKHKPAAPNNGALMYVIQVFVRVKPESIDAFKQATLQNAQASVQEPGIARFDVLQHATDPARFTLVEVYRDEHAPLQHKETPHYAAWRDRVADMMAEPRSSERYTSVFPGDDGW
jgi:quinol monooxygenase YgiN